MPNANELLKWEEYKDSTGKKLGESRQSTASMSWLVSAKNSKVYAISFEQNFAKKHLYTSTKKTDKIDTLAQKLFVDAGSPAGKSKVDFTALASEQLTQKKFIKQLDHRTAFEQGKACTQCKHDQSKHFTGSGGPKLSGKKCDAPGCTCTGWAGVFEAYKDKRTTQGKPDVNPLEGTPTPRNTVIWMNKIDKAKFEQVVSDAIIAKELERAGKTPAQAWAQGHTGKDIDCEHILLNFGIPGSVMFLEGSDPSKWKELQSATVSIKNLKSTDPAKPSYAITHMHAS